MLHFFSNNLALDGSVNDLFSPILSITLRITESVWCTNKGMDYATGISVSLKTQSSATQGYNE